MRSRLVILSIAAVLAVSACRVERPLYGGDAEQQLAAATTAVDLVRVHELLAAGADPNKMVDVDGHWQSPWFLALYQVRSRRPDMVEIVRVMLKAGANPESVWGTSTGAIKTSFWKSLTGPSRKAGSGEDSTLHVAMLHPVPDVVRAILASGFNPRHGEAELVMAIEAGDIEIAHMLVDAGVDVNSHAGANTPLVAAIEARNVPLMIYLEDHGAREKP